jgi:Domain of unknown function (DUF4412)
MRHFNFFLIIFPAFLFLSCSGSSAANSVKDSSSTLTSASSGSGDDMYYELTSVSIGKNINMKMVTVMYVSSKGDMRVEMHTDMSFKGHKSPIPMVLIGHANKPDESIIIDDSAKTYIVHHIDSADLNAGIKTESSVTKVGEEKVLGYDCVHAKVISNKKMGSFYNETDTINVWRSKDVPMQSNVKELFTQFESRTGSYMYSKETAARLKEMGCEGFLVKLTMNGKNVSMVMQLTKAEHRNLAASMFQIPAGYKETKEGIY